MEKIIRNWDKPDLCRPRYFFPISMWRVCRFGCLRIAMISNIFIVEPFLRRRKARRKCCRGSKITHAFKSEYSHILDQHYFSWLIIFRRIWLRLFLCEEASGQRYKCLWLGFGCARMIRIWTKNVALIASPSKTNFAAFPNYALLFDFRLVPVAGPRSVYLYLFVFNFDEARAKWLRAHSMRTTYMSYTGQRARRTHNRI